VDVLTDLGYWPATPSRPNLAFSFSFLDWMEALLLEAQVPSQDYCSAIEFILKDRLSEVSMLYFGTLSLICALYAVIVLICMHVIYLLCLLTHRLVLISDSMQNLSSCHGFF